MAYYTTNTGQVLVPSNQYVSQQAYATPTVNVFNDRPLPLPGRYAVTFNKTSSICLGVLLVCSGAVAMAGSAIAFRYYADLSEIGAGLWCGAMFVAAGSVAIAAGYHLSDNLICATTATSAFAIAFAIALTTISSIGLSEDIDHYDGCYELCGNNGNNCPCDYNDWEDFAIAANAVMIGAGASALIFSIWLFVICCVALCRTPNARVVPITVQCVPNTQQTMTTTVIPNHQMLSVPVQYVQLSTAPNQPVTVLHQAHSPAPVHRRPERSEDHQNHHAGDHDD